MSKDVSNWFLNKEWEQFQPKAFSIPEFHDYNIYTTSVVWIAYENSG